MNKSTYGKRAIELEEKRVNEIEFEAESAREGEYRENNILFQRRIIGFILD